MSVAKKIAYNAAISSVSKVLSTILALVGISLMTRYLGTSGFGDYATVLAFFGFFVSIGDLGLYSVATREISRTGAAAQKIMGAVFMLRIATATAIVVLSPALIYFLPYEPHVKMGIFLGAIAFAFATSYGVLNGIFQKHLAMDRVAVTELLGKIVQVGIIFTAVKLDAGFAAMIIAILCAMLFNFVVLFFLSRRFVAFVPRVDVAYWKKFLKMSLPMGVAVFVTFLYIKTDTILLSILSSPEEVGIYNGAYKVVDNLAFFPAMIIGLMLPILSRYIFIDQEKFTLAADKTLKVFFLLAVPLIVATLFMADFIVLVIGGEAFAASANVLRVLVFASALIFFGHFFNNILLAGNLQKKLMWVLSIAAVFNISANLFLIPRFGYHGAAAVSVATELLVVAFGAALTIRYLKYFPHIVHWWRIISAGGAMALTFFLLSHIHILLAALVAVMVYAALVWTLKIVTREELTSIFARGESAPL